MTPGAPIVALRGVSRSFDGVAALRSVDLDVVPGECHAIVGENGAGKSTLLRILAGAETSDMGRLRIDGRDVARWSPLEARRAGIEMVHQETSLVPTLSVAENVVLGREPRIGQTPFVDRKAARAEARAALVRLGVEIDPDARTKGLSVALRQCVEIGKALARSARVIALDEPTAALTGRETERLLDCLRALARSGAAILFVSHRLEEVMSIADRVTVLRDGRAVAAMPGSEATRAALVRAMAGRDLAEAPAVRATPGPVVLRAESIATVSLGARGVCLELRSGEITGLAGLVGSGRSSVARALAGAEALASGTIRVRGAVARFRSPRDAMRHGIGFVPEDRRADGLLLARSVRENLTLASLRALSSFGGFMGRRAETSAARRAAGDVRLDLASIERAAGALSGGNQQKTLLGRVLLAGASILVLDEPTRGVDVAAKEEIHELLRTLAGAGAAILVVSSEIEEILAVSDRVVVLRDGRVAGEWPRESATPRLILDRATGGA